MSPRVIPWYTSLPTAHSTVGAGGSLEIVSGNNQTGTVGVALAAPLVARWRNGNGQPEAGKVISWEAATDGSFSSGTSTTDANGLAQATYTHGTFAGLVAVNARASGGQAVQFTATANPGAAARLVALSATDQSAIVLSPVTDPPSVRAEDAYGNGVAGEDVTFDVASGGGTLDPAGPVVVTTDANGIASVTSWTLGGATGTNSVTATATGLTGSPVTFTADATSSGITQLVAQGGTGQTGIVAGQPAATFTYRVKDVGGNGVAGRTVSFTVQAGGGSLDQASAVTDANGDATVTLTTGTVMGVNTVRASCVAADGSLLTADISTTTVAGAAAKVGIRTQPSSTGTSGVALSQQPILEVQDANGNLVASASGTMTASIASGNGTIGAGATATITAGVATYSGFTLNDLDGGSNTVQFDTGGLTPAVSDPVTLAPPIPYAVRFVTQPGNVIEDTSSLGCSVEIVDNTGARITSSTAAVTVALTSAGGATLGGTLTVNCVSGLATFTGLSVDLPGNSYSLTATSGALVSATSNSFTVSAASGAHPNEPAGFTKVTEQDCAIAYPNTVAGTLYQNIGVSGEARQWYDVATPNVASVTDQADLSRLSASAYQMIYRTSLTGGTAPCDYGRPFVTAEKGTELYFDFDWKVSSNWSGNTSGVNKMLFITAGGASAQPFYLSATGSGSNALHLEVRLQGCPGGIGGNGNGGAQNLSYDFGSSKALITRGSAFRGEVYAKMNTTTGGVANADGVLRAWVNGVQIYNKTAMAFRGNTNVGGASNGLVGASGLWDMIKANPTYGGGPPGPPAEQYFWLGYLYISTKA